MKDVSSKQPPQTGGSPLWDAERPSMSEEDQATLQQALKRVSWIVLPLVMASNITLLLDRGSLAFAGPAMNQDLGFDANVFGLASGLFYVTYGFLQVPGAAIGVRVGMRWWLGAMTILWGVIAACTSLVQTAGQLYALRLLLGAAEASAAPCAWHIFSSYYPYDRVAKPYSTVFFCNQLAFFIAAPIAAGLLSMDGVKGIAGWRWLFLIEGIPSVIVGVAMMVFLPCEPLKAYWLTHHQREVLHSAVHGSNAEAAREKPSLRMMARMAADTFKCLPFYIYALAGIFWVTAAWSFHGWIPIIISNMLKGTFLSDATAAGAGRDKSITATLVSTIPYACGAIGVVLIAWWADRQKRKSPLPIAAAYIVGGVLLACSGPVGGRSVAGALALMSVANGLAYGGTGVLVARVSGLFPPSHTAITLSILNSVTAGLGGFIGPIIVGNLVTALRTFATVSVVLGCFLIACALLVGVAYFWELKRYHRPGRSPASCGALPSDVKAVGGVRPQTFSTAAAVGKA